MNSDHYAASSSSSYNANQAMKESVLKSAAHQHVSHDYKSGPFYAANIVTLLRLIDSGLIRTEWTFEASKIT